MSCGPYALFRYLLETEGSTYTHVWVMADPADWKALRKAYAGMENVQFVKYKSRAYNKYLATAGYVINNVTFPQYFRKRQGQTYINTWHGIPLKKMGYDMPNGAVDAANIVRNFLQADYLLSPNAHHTDMYLKAYKLKDIYAGTILETGQARTDTIVKALQTDKKAEVLAKLRRHGVVIEEGKKIILYAPTWRGTNWGSPGDAATEYEDFYTQCCSSIDTKRYTVLVKPHVAVYQKLKRDGQWTKPYFVPGNLDTNELLSVVDILISDYSSIFYDFLITGRPVLFYCNDLEAYAAYRGVEDITENLPGPMTADRSELFGMLRNIERVQAEYQAQYTKIRNRHCPKDDGQVCRRIAETVFLHKKGAEAVYTGKQTGEKKKILFFLGALRAYGIAYSLLSLLRNLDYEKYDVTVYVYAPKNEGERERLSQIPKEVRVLVHTKAVFGNMAEMMRFAVGLEADYTGKTKQWLSRIAEQEFIRMFGQSRFDYVIDYVGYSPLFALVAANAPCGVKSIWQHTDLLADQYKKVGKKQPNKKRLERVLRTYPDFDHIVGCSPSVMEINRKNLGTPETEQNYTCVKNCIDLERIEKGLEEEPIIHIDKAKLNFVTMGRLSTEKNQKALICAFLTFVKTYPESRLYIMGDGPLRAELEAQAGGEDSPVILLGNVANPFAVMKQCDCFVLPSLHEGLPGVVMEARVLEMPILVSDFSTVQDCLMENGQLVIGKSEADILKGLEAFVRGEVPQYAFDGATYNHTVVADFEQVIR